MLLFEKNTAIRNILEDMDKKNASFDWINLATSSLLIGDTIEDIKKSQMHIPRTGHIGNWEDIFYSQAGSLDYNYLVCNHFEVGYPYIFDFNQTETKDLSSGDTIYLPASKVKKGKQKPLETYIYDKESFHKTDPSLSYFTPYVFIKEGNDFKPLVQTHKENMEELYNNITYQSELILKKFNIVEKALEIIINKVLETPNNQKLLETIIDRIVISNGLTYRIKPKVIGGQIIFDDLIFENAKEVIDSIKDTIKTIYEPNINNITQKRKRILLSNHMVQVINMLLLSQFSYQGENGDISVHIQWGAIGMSGIPPFKKAYFTDNRKRVRSIFDALLSSGDNSFKKSLFIIIPSIVLILLHRDTSYNDVNILNSILKILDENIKDYKNFDTNIIKEELVNAISKEFNQFSPYMKEKIINLRSPLYSIEHDNGRYLSTGGILDLSFRKAIITLGILMRCVHEN